MNEPETTRIRSTAPRREWLLRCSDTDGRVSTCSVCVTNGTVEVVGPRDDVISLSPGEIAEFHAALHEAIERAEADLSESV
jgi:hypothetical protein